jgi:hypothetical protein
MRQRYMSTLNFTLTVSKVSASLRDEFGARSPARPVSTCSLDLGLHHPTRLVKELAVPATDGMRYCLKSFAFHAPSSKRPEGGADAESVIAAARLTSLAQINHRALLDLAHVWPFWS